MAKLFANSGDTDQMPHSAASDLGLHCLPNTLLEVSRIQWVKKVKTKQKKKQHKVTTITNIQSHKKFITDQLKFVWSKSRSLPRPVYPNTWGE